MENLKIRVVQIPYNDNFVIFAKKKHAGGNGNLIINFAWPYNAVHEVFMHVR